MRPKDLVTLTAGQITAIMLLVLGNPSASVDDKAITMSVLKTYLEELTMTLTNKTINATNNTISEIVNSCIKSDAAIALSKLANLTTNRILGRTTAGAGTIEELTPAQVRTLIGCEVRPRQLTFIDRIDLGITGIRPHAQSGECDNFYVYGSTDTLLKKFNMDTPYALQATNASPLTGGTLMTQINGIFAKDDWLYVGANDWSYSPTPPNRGYIRRYLKSTLAYVDEFQVGINGTVGWCEGATWYDGYWWVCYFDENYISKFTSAWVWVQDYAVNAAVDGGQGGRWIDNLFYRPITAAGTPKRIEQYVFDGTTFDLLDTIDAATTYANQAIGKKPGTKICYFGECRYDLGTPTNNIVICELD